jgi:hypothetical protein
MLSRLPVDVYQVIRSYAASEGKDIDRDYRSLMNTSQKLFSQVKYETTRFSFRNRAVVEFDQFFPKLKSTYDQMSLWLTFHESSHFFSLYHIREHSIPLQLLQLDNFPVANFHFSDLPPILHLHIKGCYDMVKLEPLPRITKLTLESCKLLIDISSLNDRNHSILESVTLINCEKLNKIDALYGLKRVVIKNCALITDVSTLGNHQVFIFDSVRAFFYCGSFQNFKNAETLSIRCKGFLEDCNFDELREMKGELLLNLGILLNPFPGRSFQGRSLTFCFVEMGYPNFLWNCPNLVSLTLTQIFGIDFAQFQSEVLPTLQFLKKLVLHDSSEICNVSGMGKISELTLSKLPDLTSLSGLGKDNRYVELRDLGKVTDFTPLNGVHKVLLFGYLNFRDFRDFSNIHYLELHSMFNLVNLGNSPYNRLENIGVLRLFRCDSLQTLYGLGDVKHLIVDGCINLKDISDLENNESVMITGCPKITQLFKDGGCESLILKIPKFIVI